MRGLLPLTLLAVMLTACTGTQKYSSRDFQQVHQGWAELRVTYPAFRAAFKADDTAGILAWYHRERQQCKLVDEIDNRDSIDPNINLFWASAALDDICNTIETAYTTWARPHGYPYDKNIVPARPAEIFVGMDLEFKEIPKMLRHPDSLH